MKRHLFRRMGRFLRPQAPSLAGAAALAALSGLLALLVPLVAGWAVEAIGTGPGAADLTAVLRYCAAGLGAAVLCLQLRRLRRPGAGGADRILHIAEGSFSANHSATGPVF